MICESGPWKDALGSDAKELSRLRHHNNDEKNLVAIERVLFTGSFSIRKLMDANKLTDKCKAKNLISKIYNILGDEIPDHINRYHLDEFYDLSKFYTNNIGLRYFCNLLIHSFIFVINDESEGVVKSVFVASDRERISRIFEISLDEMIGAFESVASDKVSHSTMARDKCGQWTVSNS